MRLAPFPAALQTLFAETAERSAAQEQLFVTAPGLVVALTKNGTRYLYRRTYGPDGRRLDEYLGREDDPEAIAKAAALRARIEEARALAEASRTLRKAGFAATDNSTAVTLAALFNAGLFRQGALLVGTHAFGALLNMLGVRQPANYYTEDVDIARYGTIQLAVGSRTTFIDMLRTTGLDFVEVPELDVRRPSTSYRARGTPLRVDLLVPGDTRYRSVRIPELNAHATALPYLGYLLDQPTRGVVLGRDHVIPVALPNAARFAVHKAVVATLRAGTVPIKRDKDLRQAAVLMETLAEDYPDDLRAAAEALPDSGVKRFRAVLPQLLPFVSDNRDDLRDLVSSLAPGRRRYRPGAT
jgi:hypothetical protein